MEESLEIQIQNTFQIETKDVKQYSSLGLAYIGDSVYDLIIRTIIVKQANRRVNVFHHMASSIVKAESQAKLMHQIEDRLSEEEKAVYKRGRNTKSATSAKNADILDYRVATGFEALIGYLYLTDRMNRILELVKEGLIVTGQMPKA